MSGFRPERPETVFTYGAPGLKFGVGARHELAFDLGQLGARRVLVVTDPGVAATGAPTRSPSRCARTASRRSSSSGARVEPTDASMIEAIEFARSEGPFDAIVAIGGGSSIDTAKAVNLLVTNDGDLMDYVNAPVGRGPGAHQPAAPARRRPDHHRHRQREHHHLRARRPGPARQDRHLAPAAASDARGRRPRAHRHPAGRRHRRRGPRHPVPRAGELHRAPVRVVRAQDRRRARARTAGRTRSPTCGRSRRSC